MFRNKSIAFKLSFFCGVLLLGLFFLLSLILGYFQLKEKNEELRADGIRAARATAAQLNDILIRAQSTTQTLSQVLSAQNLNYRQIKELQLAVTRNLHQFNPELVATNISFEPHTIQPQEQYCSLLAYAAGKEYKQVQMGSDRLPYFTRDWYLVPKWLNRGLWTTPFYSEGGINSWLILYVQPFYKGLESRQFAGVVTADIDVRRLRPLLVSAGLDGVGYGFVISQFGQILIHPEQKLEFNESIFSLLAETGNREEREAGRDILQTPEGANDFFFWTFFSGGTKIFHATCVNGWKVCVAVPSDWTFLQLLEIAKRGLWVWLGLLVLTVSAISILLNRMSRPLRELAVVSQAIGQGNFNTPLPAVRSGDEIGTLTSAFQTMQQELTDYIKRLEQNITARERIEGELNAARTIQNDILPKMLPPLPDTPDFSLAPVLRAARGIGGDLYDIFLRGENELVFLIGDVSGKGVPAALFMAVAQTLHRNIAGKGGSPGQIITELNRNLASNNNAMMFLTCWLGILDIPSGRVRFCNAGHNPPLLLHRGGKVEELETLHGSPLGIFETDYADSTFDMKQGDTIYLYTDGVTEAFSQSGEMFDTTRLIQLAAILNQEEADPQIIRDRILKAVDEFSTGCEQSDDITMLVMRYNRQA